MMADWGVKLSVNIAMDASAGISIGSRRGLGQVKHIDTCYLWVQEIVDQGRIRLKKVNTQDMLADLMTKPLDGQTATKLLGRMGYCVRNVVGPGSDRRQACPMFWRGQCKWGPKCKLSHDSSSFESTMDSGSWRPPSQSGGKSVGFKQSSDLFKADRCGALW
eukprot:s1430_g25.t1